MFCRATDLPLLIVVVVIATSILAQEAIPIYALQCTLFGQNGNALMVATVEEFISALCVLCTCTYNLKLTLIHGASDR